MADRETTIETGGGGGGLGIVLAVLIVVLLVAGGFLVFSRSGNSVSATLDVPKITVETPKG